VKRDASVGDGVVEHAVRFASRGGSLAGVLSLPEGGATGSRAVVILHGWGTYRCGPHDILVKMARSFAACGMPALRFDLSGRGESAGAYDDTDLDGMIDDAAAACRFVKARTGATDVAAVGLCSGGNVGLGAAAHRGSFDRVASLSVLPFQSHKSAMQSLRRTGGMFRRLVGKALRPSTWWRLLTGRVRVFRVFKTLFGGEGGTVKTAGGETRNLKDSAHDLMGALAKYRGRLLFVWGGADAEGRGARAHFAEFASLSGLDARFETIEGSNHNFYSRAWERDVIARVRGFVAAD